MDYTDHCHLDLNDFSTFIPFSNEDCNDDERELIRPPLLIRIEGGKIKSTKQENFN